jgi:hypothetical protein
MLSNRNVTKPTPFLAPAQFSPLYINIFIHKYLKDSRREKEKERETERVSPGGEWGGRLLLARGVHVDHGEVLRDLLHVLIVEQGVEAGLVWGGGHNSGMRAGWSSG